MNDKKNLNQRIYLSPPHMEGGEFEYLKNAFESNWIAPVGPDIKEFEKEMSHYTGTPNALALSSGTAAIHLALMISGIGPGDLVLCSSFTFAGSVNPVVYTGAEPVFIDSEESSWNMDPEVLHDAVTDLKKKGKLPKACILVHLYGMCADTDPVKEICRDNGIILIEDAAESLGAFYKGRHTGTSGDYGVLSFNGNKIITTSGGGMLVSGNKEKIDEAGFLATQARDDTPYYQHSRIGYNYRMSNLCAAVGRGQLRHIEKKVEKKRYLFNNYMEMLSDVDGISFMPELSGTRGNRWLTCIVVDREKTGCRPEDLRTALESENIESRPLWKPMHLQPVFKGCRSYGTNVCERLFESGLCLPSGTGLSEGEMTRVVDIIKGVIKKK